MKHSDLTYVKSLLYYDGDLLSLWETPQGTPLVKYWNTVVQRAVFEEGTMKLILPELWSFYFYAADPVLLETIPIRDWIRTATAIYSYVENNDELISITIDELDEDYLPKEGVFLHMDE